MADLFRCPLCSEHQKIPVRRYSRRKKGHVKTLWCWRCKKTTQHVRI